MTHVNPMCLDFGSKYIIDAHSHGDGYRVLESPHLTLNDLPDVTRQRSHDRNHACLLSMPGMSMLPIFVWETEYCYY